MTRFYVPELNLEAAFSLNAELQKLTPENEFILDFTKMKNFDPFPMLVSGALIRNYRNQYPDCQFRLDGLANKSYPGTMGFFKYISPKIQFGKKPGEAVGNSNYIPITHLSVDSLVERETKNRKNTTIGEVIEKESQRLALIINHEDSELHIIFAYLIREILRNIPEHSMSNHMWICGQYWPTFNLAEIAILDEGIGVFNSLKKNPKHREFVVDNKSALEWAIKAGISKAHNAHKYCGYNEWANSGYGLFMVSQICLRLGGSFCIMSQDNYITLNREGLKFGDTYFNGTALRLCVPVDTIKSAQTIITEIAKQGETEARMIQNAFKKASRTSKGILTR